MVAYAIEALVHAGVTELMLVTGGTHAGEFLRLLGNGHEFGIDRLAYAYQEQPGGIAEALGLAEAVRRRRPRLRDARRQRLRAVDQARRRQLRRGRSTARASSSRARATPTTCATSACPSSTATAASTRIVEKPQSPPSEFAVTGVYFYDARRLRRDPDARAVGSRRARDHRRQQPLHLAKGRWSTTSSRGSGATPASRSTSTTR